MEKMRRHATLLSWECPNIVRSSVNRFVHLLPKTERLNGEIFHALRQAEIDIEN